MAEQQYFQDCLQCLAYTEDVVRSFCWRIFGKLHKETQLELRKVLTCTLATEQHTVEVTGWPSAVLEHTCWRYQPCNTFIKDFLENLPWASKLNRTEVLKAICQTDAFQFVKLFVEPWMCTLGSLSAMDAYCLFLLLDNVSFFHHDIPAGRHALYQQHIGKIRKLAESCLYDDVEDVTKADRDMCIQAVINALAFVCENDADEAIHNIQELRCQSAGNTQIKSETLARRSYLKQTMHSFQQEVIQAVSDILNKTMDDEHDVSEDEEELEGTLYSICSRGHTIDTRDYEEIRGYLIKRGLSPNLLDPFRQEFQTVLPKRLSHFQLVKSVAENSESCSGLEGLFSQQVIDSLPASPHGATSVSPVNYKYAQAVVFYLNNANFPNEEVRSLLDALMSPDSTCADNKKHIATLTKAVQRQGHASSSFQEIVYSETKATFFKMCYQVMLTMETGLRRHCKRKMERLHSTVTDKFPRKRLCQLADKDDLVRVNDSPSAEIIFKHECKKEPKCNTFLKVVCSQRSDKCALTPQTMFRNVNPQDCIGNVWEFTKLFLEPCMHMFNGFDELDIFCLLTLFANVKIFDGKQNEEDNFLRAVFKARDGALKALQSSKQVLTQQTMDSFFESIIFVLERCMFLGSDRLLKQIKEMRTGTSLPIFDIRLDIESRRQKCVKQFYDKSIIRDKNECNWFRIVLALKSLQPSLLPIVQKTMKTQHKYIFGPKLCLEANADDISREPGTKSVIFRHRCTGISSSGCNTLLNRIRYLTAASADLLSMLRGTDPQTWLRSPFDLTSIFLKDWMRLEVRKFEECDVGALFHLIKQCHPLRKMFNADQQKEDIMKPVRGVRNRLLHCSSMETSKQEMEEAIDELLKMLRHIEHEQVGNEVTEAIEDIVQIKIGELNLLRHEGIQLLEEVMADLKRKRIQQEHLMSMLKQNIIKIETALGIPVTSSSDKIFDGQVAEDGSVAEVKGKTSAGFLFWCRCALALKYLQFTWLPFVEKEMNALHRETLHNSRGKLCPNAKTKDIIAENDRLKFKHTCTNDCNQMLNVIQNLFPESIAIDKKQDMLQETDLQTWLSSPLEFTRLFMKKWKRSEIKEFEHCDVSALCEITTNCQSLMKKMDETMVIDVRSVRNTTVHSPTMELSQQKMEDNIDVLLTFIGYLKRNVTHLDFAEADANINRLKHGDFTLLRGNNLRLLQEFVSDMRRDVAFKQEETAELSKKLTEMEKTFSTIIAEGKLPGKQFTDTASGGVSKGWNTGMAGHIDRSRVVDRSELKKKRQETKRLLEQKKEEFQKSLREAHRQLQQETYNIQDSMRDIDKQTQTLATAIIETDINITHLKIGMEVLAKSYQPSVPRGNYGLAGMVIGGAIGSMNGPAGVLSGGLSGALLGGSIGSATGGAGALNIAGITIDATEEGCRDGIRRLEIANHERKQKKTALEREFTYLEQIHSKLGHLLYSGGPF